MATKIVRLAGAQLRELPALREQRDQRVVSPPRRPPPPTPTRVRAVRYVRD
jgi:hypothetical protein